MATDEQHPTKAVLDDAVKQLEYVETIGSHGKVRQPREIHPQPHNHITMRLVCTRLAGRTDIDFDTLMTVSGAGLLLAYEPNSMSPKYGHLHVDMDERIADATGFGWEWVPFEDAQDAWRIVTETVGSGRPVECHYMEAALFVGYEDAAGQGDRKVYVIGEPFPGQEWWTWPQFSEWAANSRPRALGRHTGEVATAPEREVALRVMCDAATRATEPPLTVTEHLPNARFGFDGIAAYADDVADAERKPSEYFRESAWRGCHAINPQWTARRSTAVYLRRVGNGDAFGADVPEHLLSAADAYDAAYQAWQAFYEHLGYIAPKDAWDSSEHRKAGAVAIREALAHEQAAVEKLKRALALVQV